MDTKLKEAHEFLESMNIPIDATWGMFDIDKMLVAFAEQQVNFLKQGAVMPLLPDDFICEWVTDKVDCAFRGKKCNVCSKAVSPPKTQIRNYFAPYKKGNEA